MSIFWKIKIKDEIIESSGCHYVTKTKFECKNMDDVGLAIMLGLPDDHMVNDRCLFNKLNNNGGVETKCMEQVCPIRYKDKPKPKFKDGNVVIKYSWAVMEWVRIIGVMEETKSRQEQGFYYEYLIQEGVPELGKVHTSKVSESILYRGEEDLREQLVKQAENGVKKIMAEKRLYNEFFSKHPMTVEFEKKDDNKTYH